MVTISLTNKNPDSNDHSVTINLNSGVCSFPDKREVPLCEFIKQEDFVHPLLSEPFVHSADHVYLYEYDNITQLFYSAVFVYKTLLHADNPNLCVFKIQPSCQFKQNKVPDDLYFSIDGMKPATELISVVQLNEIVSTLMRDSFEYSEDFVINDTFTVDQLPSSVNGDLFYPDKEPFYEIFEHTANLSRLELRYINPVIGFGVFCREPIKAGEFLGIYTGVKQVNLPSVLNYSYRQNGDSLSMILDGRNYGNITRFINHAPNPDKNAPSADSSNQLFSNSKCSIYIINGLSFMVYLTTRDVMPGEQLLVDYGSAYFQKSTPILFKSNGRPVNRYNRMSNKKLGHLRVMAHHGVVKAQRYLQLRMVFIITLIFILMAGLHLLSI